LRAAIGLLSMVGMGVTIGTAVLVTPSIAHAQSVAPAPSGVLQLSASASDEVPADEIHITLFTERQGNDSATVAQQLNQQTQQALDTARSQSLVKVSTGSFSISPSTDRDGKIIAWRGRSELVLESQDFTAASKLAGDLGNQMQVADVSFSLSRDKRQQAEARLSDLAIAAFRRKADTASKAFGYHGFSIREVQLGHSDSIRQPRIAMMSMAAAPMAKMSAVPVEGGTTTVSVDVNGSVQMVP
jgi:predicted secreted protein